MRNGPGIRRAFRKWIRDRSELEARLIRTRRHLLELAGSDARSRPSLHQIEDRLDDLFSGRAGYFVEVGGFDGFSQSNTYWLERFRGWRGLLVEPVPEQAARCVANRHRDTAVVQCALVPPSHRAGTVTVHHAGLMSIVEGVMGSRDQDSEYVERGVSLQPGVTPYTVDVPARTLTDVLDSVGAPTVIDLLVLDVEGMEPAVLDGLDISRYRPRFVLIEMSNREESDAALRSLGYELLDPTFTPFDALYRSASGR